MDPLPSLRAPWWPQRRHFRTTGVRAHLTHSLSTPVGWLFFFNLLAELFSQSPTDSVTRPDFSSSSSAHPPQKRAGACRPACCCQQAHAISLAELVCVCVSTRPPDKPPIHSLGRTRVRLLPPALPVKLGFGEAQIPPRDAAGAPHSAPTTPAFVVLKEQMLFFFSNFGETFETLVSLGRRRS